MKGGKLHETIVIKDPSDAKKHFRPYTWTWHGVGQYGFFVGLGEPNGEIGYKDFFCTVDDKGKITKIEKQERLFFARLDGATIKKYLDSFTNIHYDNLVSNDYDNAYKTLDNVFGRDDGFLLTKYYIHSYDNYDAGKTVTGKFTGESDGFELLTHILPKTIKTHGGKRKTRRVKKSNRKSNRKRRSNTKRHTRKH